MKLPKTSHLLPVLLITLLIGCQTAPALTPQVGSPVSPASVEELPPATNTPAATNTPLPPEAGPQTITFEQNGQTITLKTGAQFTLQLDEGFTWAITLSNENILRLVEEEVKGKGGEYSGLFEALQAGQVQLTAGGDPLCRQARPACGMPSVLFQLTVIVE